LVINGVAIDEIVEDFVGCPLVKTLVDENPDHGVGELLDAIGPAFLQIARDRPEQHGPPDIVAIG
jgi:hypothetical protein